MTFVEYTPTDYLMIDIATNYGDADLGGKIVDLDKVNFEERISWFKKQERAGTLTALITSADKPALYFAGLLAYNDMMAGKTIGYPISLDACSSGLQLLATMANCKKSALRCGVVSTGHREDAYSSLFETMKEKAGTLKISATRKDLKNAMMKALYGSTAEPERIFGTGKALELFYETLEEEIPGAWNLNIAIKSLWQPFATEHVWTLPDGFEVCMTVRALDVDEVLFMGKKVSVYTKQLKGTPKGRSLSPNIVHSIDGLVVREMERRCSFDQNQVKKVLDVCNTALARTKRRDSTTGRGRKNDELLKKLWANYVRSGFLSARVIDVIDENNISMISASLVKNLISTLPIKPFDMLTIHDCFKAHPNYGNDLRRQYNHVLSDLAKSEVLADIATQITGRKKALQKLGNISKKILEANYALS